MRAVENKRRLAHREAAAREQQLAEKRLEETGWEVAVLRYEMEYLDGLSTNYQRTWNSACSALEMAIKPSNLADVDASALSRFEQWLRRTPKLKPGRPTRKKAKAKPPDSPPKFRSERTVASYLKHVRAFLGWAEELGLIDEAPKMRRRDKRSKGRKAEMRARPVKLEEFERMLAAVERVRPDDAPLWKDYLTGLWSSGLRLAESVALSWEWRADFSVSLDGQKYPEYRILAEGEKGGEDRRLPIDPEFAAMLRRTPTQQRRGRVFKLPYRRSDSVGEVVRQIGRAAGVVVNRLGKTASAHDFRRAFGTRWAVKVAPAVLQQLMRHKSIETTMKYYVYLDVEDLGAIVWADAQSWDLGGILGETTQESPDSRIAKEHRSR